MVAALVDDNNELVDEPTVLVLTPVLEEMLEFDNAPVIVETLAVEFDEGVEFDDAKMAVVEFNDAELGLSLI